jgi:hypothetical protein
MHVTKAGRDVVVIYCRSDIACITGEGVGKYGASRRQGLLGGRACVLSENPILSHSQEKQLISTNVLYEVLWEVSGCIAEPECPQSSVTYKPPSSRFAWKNRA